MENKLKIGILIKKGFVKSFEFEILKALKGSDLYESVLCVCRDEVMTKQNPLLNASLLADRALNARGKDHTALVSYDALELPAINVSEVERLKQENFDLLIHLGKGKLPQEIVALAKYGVWELRYGKSQTDADMAGIMEVLRQEESTLISLIKLPDLEGNGYVIDTMLCGTHELSPVKNRSDIVWKSHALLLRNLEKLALNPETFITQKYQELYFFKDQASHTPKLCDTALGVVKLLCQNITSRFDRLFRKQQWSIYYALNDESTRFNQNMSAFVEIPTPKEQFWADPFVVDKDDKSYIFFEAYVYKTHKGHLSVIEYDHKDGKFFEPKEVLNLPYHLSYPFMMEHEGVFYMIPEGSKDRDVKLYRAKNFPYEWEVVKVLLKDIVAVDTTLFYHEDRWWLFANVAEKEGFSLNEELYIYHCKDFLTDDWTPHAQNPIMSSVQTSRPAGGILEYEGSFYRPSQNSVGWYGRSTNINKIITLTPQVYEEKLVSEITHEYINGIYAVHTYNASKKMTVIDGLKKIGRFF